MKYTEGKIEFEFDDEIWWIISADDNHPDYRKIKNQLKQSGTKSCDIVAIYNKNEVVFCEVREMREVENKAEYKAKLRDKYLDIAQKVRDSLACIANGSRNSTNDKANWEQFLEKFKDVNNKVSVLLFFEHNPQIIQARDVEIKIGFLKKELNKQIRWLNAGKVKYMDSTNLLNYKGWEVKLLAI